jgi:cytochrome d ubiquinol oxidase subunit II
MTMDLAFIGGAVIAFAVLAYVILDGFDLGIGILFPLIEGTPGRDQAMNSVAPVWDGNETWLVLGGGGLLALFPTAYAILLPAFYAPLIAMLLGLVLRGVAFEFRWKTERAKPIWDLAFAAGSVIATLSQGLMLGALVQGVSTDGHRYAGGWFDWLTPFSVTCAIALVIGYGLLGATWLIWKTEGHVQRQAYASARWLGIGLLVAIAIVSLWTPFLNSRFFARWLSWPVIIYVAPVPVMTALAAAWLYLSLRDRKQAEPFLATLALFILCYVGFAISLYPYVVPMQITIWDAAAPDTSIAFVLIGASILLPLILAYTAYAYWVFRGKVDVEGHYH